MFTVSEYRILFSSEYDILFSLGGREHFHVHSVITQFDFHLFECLITQFDFHLFVWSHTLIFICFSVWLVAAKDLFHYPIDLLNNHDGCFQAGEKVKLKSVVRFCETGHLAGHLFLFTTPMMNLMSDQPLIWCQNSH